MSRIRRDQSQPFGFTHDALQVVLDPERHVDGAALRNGFQWLHEVVGVRLNDQSGVEPRDYVSPQPAEHSSWHGSVRTSETSRHANRGQRFRWALELVAEDLQVIPRPASCACCQFRLSRVHLGIYRHRHQSLRRQGGEPNISLPACLLSRIDAFVKSHPEHKSRSGLLAEVALNILQGCSGGVIAERYACGGRGSRANSIWLALWFGLGLLEPLCGPFATQGRSYAERVRAGFSG